MSLVTSSFLTGVYLCGTLVYVKPICVTIDFSCILLKNRQVRGLQFILFAIQPKSKSQDWPRHLIRIGILYWYFVVAITVASGFESQKLEEVSHR